jgi:hypothetical protein
MVAKTNMVISSSKIVSNEIKLFDPDVIRTRSLLIWSQTRFRCATESLILLPNLKCISFIFSSYKFFFKVCLCCIPSLSLVHVNQVVIPSSKVTSSKAINLIEK